MTGRVEKSEWKQKYLHNFKMEKYQPSFKFCSKTSTVEKEYICVVCLTLSSEIYFHTHHI